MASELFKNKALIQRLKEPDVPVINFNLIDSAKDYNIESIEEDILPEPKPQELLDIQEQNRKGRLLDSLNKIGGGLMDESLDFIKRQNFSSAGFVKTLLKRIPPYEGARKVGESTKKQRGPEKKFIEAFIDFMNKKHAGNFSAAARSIGESREKIKGIFDRVRLSETGTRAGADVGKGGGKLQTTIAEPKEKLLYKDATTAVKADQKFFKNKIKNYDKNKYYNARDLGNILELDFSNKKVMDKFTSDLKRFNVKAKSAAGVEGGSKTYQLGDVVNKITKGYEKKLVEGQRVAASERAKIDAKLDPDLKLFLGNFKQTTRNISIEEDIFIPNAIEDVGHPLSVKITDKYPKLTKNSNINKINTLTFQDPIVNQNILEATGYESKHDVLLKKLNKLVGKKIGSKELEELQEIKSTMNALYSKAVDDVANLSEEGTSLYNPRTKKTTTYQGEYFKGQENRIPKIDINIPKQGQVFKSENLFVDMSNVNPAFRVGLVDQINPNAKFFKDLTKEQKEIYKRNVLDQTKFNLDKFYTKVGFPKEQIDDLKDSLEFGTSSKLGIGTVGVLGLGSTAAAADEPGVETPDDFPTGKVVAGAAVAPLATKKGRSIYGKAAKQIARGVGKTLAPLAVPLEAGFVLSDLKSGASTPEALANIVLLGGAVRQKEKKDFISNKYGPEVYAQIQSYKSFGEDGMDIPQELPEQFQAIELEAEKFVEDERTRRAEEFIKQTEEDRSLPLIPESMSQGLYSLGGRVSFANGPDDPSKRKFMKLMGIMSLLPFGIGKAFKMAEKAAPVVQQLKNTTTTMPDWFPDFVNKALAKGVSKKIDADLTEIEIPELPGVKVQAHDDGRILVEGKNAYNEPYEINYTPPGYEVIDETTGKVVKTPGEFKASDTRYRQVGPELDDVDVDYDTVPDIEDIVGGDSTQLEGFAKGTGEIKYTKGQQAVDEADARSQLQSVQERADFDQGPDIDLSDYED